MLKRCSNCEYCIGDLKAIFMGILIDKCSLMQHNILRPFWSGWRCEEWRKRQ